MPLPIASSATPANTSIVTAPSFSGVIVALYTVLLIAEKPLTAAFTAVISAASKSVTDSLNVKVAVKLL